MNFHFINSNRRRTRSAGFTLIEMMTSVALGLVLMMGVAILFINGNECFVAMANYQNLDKYSTSAMDILSKEIRGASGVIATTSSSITFTNALTGSAYNIVYNSGLSNLVLSDVTGNTISNDFGQVSLTTLTGVAPGNWSYSNYMAVPIITGSDVGFNVATNLASIKVIQMNWKCVRTYIGRAITTESVQTAQIVLRNKTSN